MRKIDILIFRAVFPPFIITLAVLTSVVFIGKIGNWAEIFISNEVDIHTIGIICGAIFPTILIFSLPLSYLIGILIGVTGLNGESQITALRACGIPIRRLLLFILVLGTTIGFVTLSLSMLIVPRTNSYLKTIKETILFARVVMSPAVHC